MANDRTFTNPNYGDEVRVEVLDNEVALVFVAASIEKAESLAQNLLKQLEAGALNITLMGKPTKVTRGL